MSRLFILGNGFDIAHGFQTRYTDFKSWIESQIVTAKYERPWPYIPIYNEDSDNQSARNDLMKLLIHMFERLNKSGSEYDWYNFEEALYYLDVEIYHDAATEDIITEEDGITQDYVMGLSIRNADNLYGAINHIPILFSEWITSVNVLNCQIPFGTNIILSNGQLCEDDLFITFNYTETLEQNYCVPARQILHVHGFRNDGSALIVGYGNSQEREIKLSTFGGDYKYARKRLYAAMELLKKDTSSIIQKNQEFWKKIKEANIQEVYSYGFSYSPVDLPYIKKICSLIEPTQNVCWWVNSYNKSNEDKYKKRIKDCDFRGCIKFY